MPGGHGRLRRLLARLGSGRIAVTMAKHWAGQGHAPLGEGAYREAHECYRKARRLRPDIPLDLRFYDARMLRQLRAPFGGLELGNLSLQILIDTLPPGQVLDVGSGAGRHGAILADHGWTVTLNHYGRSIYFQQMEAAGTAAVAAVVLPEFGLNSGIQRCGAQSPLRCSASVECSSPVRRHVASRADSRHDQHFSH